jgi:hypothetical protein
MLRFTEAGVVGLPDAVQIRVDPSFSARVRAGAPVPSRALSDEEVLHNVQHFTEGQRGPRSRRCVTLVLSGVDGQRAALLVPVMTRARAWGVRRVVVHAEGEGLGELPVDVVAGVVRAPEDVQRLQSWAAPEHNAVLSLEAGTLGAVARSVEAILRSEIRTVTLSWPYPAGGTPAPEREVGELLAEVGPALDAAGVRWTLKGLPACLAGPFGGRATRTHNRWYVDAEHQAGAALLFRPDLLRLMKPEVCRFCALDAGCDGVAEGWLASRTLTVLRPILGTAPRA